MFCLQMIGPRFFWEGLQQIIMWNILLSVHKSALFYRHNGCMSMYAQYTVYSPMHIHTYCTRKQPIAHTNKCTEFSQKKHSPFLFRHCSCLCLSLLIRPFHLVCIDYRLTSHSDTLRGPIHGSSPHDTHWVHCGEECLLSCPELACESMSIIPSQWVLYNSAETNPPTRPVEE